MLIPAYWSLLHWRDPEQIPFVRDVHLFHPFAAVSFRLLRVADCGMQCQSIRETKKGPNILTMKRKKKRERFIISPGFRQWDMPVERKVSSRFRKEINNKKREERRLLFLIKSRNFSNEIKSFGICCSPKFFFFFFKRRQKKGAGCDRPKHSRIICIW